jgi:hypothetical protein
VGMCNNLLELQIHAEIGFIPVSKIMSKKV